MSGHGSPASRSLNAEATSSRLSRNDLRQILRIACGVLLGFLICKLMNWNYGTFFAVYPVLLLGLVPVLTAHVIRQFLASMLVVSVITLVVVGGFGDKLVPMTLLVMGIYAWLFRCMTQGHLFLFGAQCVVSLSVQLNFVSYPQTDVFDIVTSNIVGSIITVAIAMLMHVVFPDVTPRTPPKRPAKPVSNQRHEIILATTVATLSFLVFQVFDLKDSLSAQVASILVLFPLNWRGAGMVGKHRAVGTLLGCNAGLLVQMGLLGHYNVLPFAAFGLWLGCLVFARYHILEGGRPAIGFGGLTTMAILFGQYLTPRQDLVYDALYRFSSVATAVLLTLMAVYVMHHLLDRFAATRLQPLG